MNPITIVLIVWIVVCILVGVIVCGLSQPTPEPDKKEGEPK